MVGMSFPILPPSSPSPWQVKQERTRVVDLGRALSQMSKLSDYKSGIICANFGYCHGHFPVYNLAWCILCFTTHPLDCFEVKKPRNFNGALLAEVEDEVHFKQARPRDHLYIPFQCPSCQSQNIRGKGIDPNLIDNLIVECMVIQATLDASWSHSSKTIANHVQEARNMARYG